VKETFGTMIETVVEQQNEISKLNEALEISAVENVEGRKKLLDSTNRNMSTLLKHQMQLELQLRETQKKLKNFSYNMLGYTDEEEEQEFLIAHDKSIIKNVSLELDESISSNVEEEKAILLFQTEKDETAVESHGADGDSIYKKKKKSRTSVGLINYHTIPLNTLPRKPSARWRWAIRKILLMIRRKRLKIGLGRTRVAKSETVSNKLDVLESEIFFLENSINNLLRKSVDDMSNQCSKNAADLDDLLKSQSTHHNESLQSVQNKIDSFDLDLQNVNQTQLLCNEKINEMRLQLQSLEASVKVQQDILVEMKSHEHKETITPTVVAAPDLVNESETIKMGSIFTDLSRKIDVLFQINCGAIDESLKIYESSLDLLKCEVMAVSSSSNTLDSSSITKLFTALEMKESFLSQMDLQIRILRNMVSSYKSGYAMNSDGSAETVETLSRRVEEVPFKMSEIVELIAKAKTKFQEDFDKIEIKSEDPHQTIVETIRTELALLPLNQQSNNAVDDPKIILELSTVAEKLNFLSTQHEKFAQQLGTLSVDVDNLKDMEKYVAAPSLSVDNLLPSASVAISDSSELKELAESFQILRAELIEIKTAVENIQKISLSNDLPSRPSSSKLSGRNYPPKPAKGNSILLDDSPRDSGRRDQGLKGNINLPLHALSAKRETPAELSFPTPKSGSRANSASSRMSSNNHTPHYYLSEISNPIVPQPSIITMQIPEEELKATVERMVVDLLPKFFLDFAEKEASKRIPIVDMKASFSQTDDSPSFHENSKLIESPLLEIKSQKITEPVFESVVSNSTEVVSEEILSEESKRKNTGNLIGSFVDYDAKNTISVADESDEIISNDQKERLSTKIEVVTVAFDPSPLLADIATLRAEIFNASEEVLTVLK